MKQVLIVLAVVLAIGSVGYLLTRSQNARDTTSVTTQNQSTNQTQLQESTTQVQNGNVSVSISNFDFPDNIKINKGSTVTWTNRDSAQHNVVSDSDSPQGGINGQLLSKDESFSFTFTEVGTYNYHCQPHSFMTGTVEVVE